MRPPTADCVDVAHCLHRGLSPKFQKCVRKPDGLLTPLPLGSVRTLDRTSYSCSGSEKRGMKCQELSDCQKSSIKTAELCSDAQRYPGHDLASHDPFVAHLALVAGRAGDPVLEAVVLVGVRFHGRGHGGLLGGGVGRHRRCKTRALRSGPATLSPRKARKLRGPGKVGSCTKNLFVSFGASFFWPARPKLEFSIARRTPSPSSLGAPSGFGFIGASGCLASVARRGR